MAWRNADLRFDRDGGWTGEASALEPWPVEASGLTLELRPTEAGQIGLFPEHLEMLPWLRSRVAERVSGSVGIEASSPPVLNLFAYTGLASLAIAAAGAGVTHVDSSRPTVAWARSNAERSGLGKRPIRWLVDDAVAFVAREIRRGRRYAGVVLDPPSYGHGPAGQAWRIDRDLASLLRGAVTLIEPGGFLLLTAHSPGLDGHRLAGELAVALTTALKTIERGALAISTADGRRLELGAFARWPGAAS